MNRRPSAGADAAAAGFMLIASILLCGAVAFGLGSLVGIGVPLGLVGFFAGLVVGLLLVHARYRRI